MKITKACSHILEQLIEITRQIQPADYTTKVEVLNGSTIGQHLRHTIEFFICFQEGFESGVINYDLRSHDKTVETDKFIALSKLTEIVTFINGLQQRKTLKLHVSYDLNNDDFSTIDSNCQRELVYNIEHAVHHMAIMKIGLKEVAPYVNLPADFGIAASTIRHQSAQHHPAH